MDPNLQKSLEDFVIQGSKYIIGKSWHHLKKLDLTSTLTPEKWATAPSKEEKEVLILQIIIMASQMLSQRLSPETLSDYIVIQVLLNHSDPKVRLDIVEILNNAEKLYLQNKSA